MPNLRVTSTGKIFWDVPPLFAGILCEALPTVFEIVRHVPAATSGAAPTGPRFWCGPSAHTGNLGIHVQKPSGETVSVYVAASKAAAEAALGAGEMPQSVWDTYAAKTNADKDPEWLGDQAARQVAHNKW
jgi:hypothetical protein